MDDLAPAGRAARLHDVEMSLSDRSRESGLLEKPSNDTATDLLRLCPSINEVTLLKGRGGRFVPLKPTRLRNSLLESVGLLELANAGDFAANVWNNVPVPAYVIFLMVTGGTFALVLSVCAFCDARLSWRNVCVLREQRRALHDERAQRLKEAQPVADIDVLLDVTFRELGSELINRECMNILMGFGAFLICIGTFLAIDGIDPTVWFTSNLLSGYVGNAPLAAYSLVNSAWAIYVWRKAHQHMKAGRAALGERGIVLAQLKRRVRNVQTYTLVNAVTSILGGVGSMMTATMWYGYIILVPVIISSIFCNVWWRKRVGYDRPFLADSLGMSLASLSGEIELARSSKLAVGKEPATPFGGLADPTSLASVVEFLVVNDFFEDFCIGLFAKSGLGPTIFATGRDEVTVDAEGLLGAPEEYHHRIVEAAQTFVRTSGAKRFQEREWYLLEVLGSLLYLPHAAETTKER
jgi:hypothetical protein